MKNTIHTIDLQFLGVDHAISCYLIETSDGPVLIDCGPYSTIHRLESEIRRFGFYLEDIKNVLLTHIHLDHAGAAWVFAKNNAQIYLHPIGMKHMEKPGRLIESARQIYKDDMDRLWGDMNDIPKELLIPIEHHETVTIGQHSFKSLHTPGHAKHHIAWQLEDVIFSGDVGGVKIGKGAVQPPCPPPDIYIEEWLESIEILKSAQPSALYLTHFGRVDHLDQHFEELKEMLGVWSLFIKEKMDDGLTSEEITPLFMDFTIQQQKDVGLNDHQIKEYLAANPMWMSVLGLMRYWKKKSQARS